MCKKRHHTLLHPSGFQRQQNDTSPQGTCETAQTLLSINDTSASAQEPISQVRNPIFSEKSVSCKTLLATASVFLFDKNGKRFTACALLDNGSQTSFVTSDLVKKLNLPTDNKCLQTTSISCKVTNTQKVAQLKVYSMLPNKPEFSVSCIVLDYITSNLPRISVKSSINLPPNLTLADPAFLTSKPIDLLLGMDVYAELLCPGIEKLGPNLLILINTHLGWTVSGNVPITYQGQRKNVNVYHSSCEKARSEITASNCNDADFFDPAKISQLLEKFWNIEECQDQTTFLSIPLKGPSEQSKLGDSFQYALKRFLTLASKLHKKSDLFNEYRNFIDGYLALGHAKEIILTSVNFKGFSPYFLPHHCVIREDSATTKLRVVFDASMKTSSGISLNDIMLKGTVFAA